MRPRTKQVSAEINRVIANNLTTDAKDPRFKNITIVEVAVSPDLQHAKVFFSQWKSDYSNEEMCQALNKATPWLQQKISQQLALKSVPKLKFFIDPSPAQGSEIEALLQKIRH